MIVRLVRAALPWVMVAGGGAALVYGARHHAAPVVEEREVDETVRIPAPFAMGPPMGPPGPMGMPPPMGPDAFITKHVTKKIFVTEAESEPQLVREITFGGVTLAESGELRRTYSGTPPSLCPT